MLIVVPLLKFLKIHILTSSCSKCKTRTDFRFTTSKSIHRPQFWIKVPKIAEKNVQCRTLSKILKNKYFCFLVALNAEQEQIQFENVEHWHKFLANFASQLENSQICIFFVFIFRTCFLFVLGISLCVNEYADHVRLGVMCDAQLGPNHPRLVRAFPERIRDLGAAVGVQTF